MIDDLDMASEAERNPFKDEKKILAIVADKYGAYKSRRSAFEREWYRNILFLLGNQWIKWDAGRNGWRKHKLESWIPTPVTNRFASTGERLTAVIARIEPNWSFVPATDSDADMAAADAMDKLEDVIAEENNIAKIRDKAAKWVTFTGNVFLFSGVEKQPEGGYKQYTDICSPFEVFADMTIEDIEDQSAIIIVNRRSQEYIKNLYGEEGADSGDDSLGMSYLESIAYASTESGADTISNDSKIKRVVVKRLLLRPTRDWPEGLYAVVAGDKVLESGPLPKTKEGKPFIPISHIKFDPVPGAFFGRTPMNDLPPKQTQRNRLESLIELITLRMASPVWLFPSGVTVKGTFSGTPGSVINYDSMNGNSKPDRIPGEQIPSTLMNWLEKIDKDFEEIGSTFDAMKGQAPYSGAPGVVINQLVEQGFSRFGPAFRNVAEGYRQWMKTQIELFRVYGGEKTVRTLGENSKWKIEKFSNANVSGGVDVRIESDSQTPKSEQVEVAKIMSVLQLGIIPMEDLTVRMKVLRKIGLASLVDTVDKDMLDAARENDLLLSGQPVEVYPFVDNHDIHIAQHRALAKTEEGEQAIQRLTEHITKHFMTKDAESNPGGQGQPAPLPQQHQGNGPPPVMGV